MWGNLPRSLKSLVQFCQKIRDGTAKYRQTPSGFATVTPKFCFLGETMLSQQQAIELQLLVVKLAADRDLQRLNYVVETLIALRRECYPDYSVAHGPVLMAKAA